MFFERFVLYVAGLLPKRSKLYRHFCLVFNRNACEEKVVTWHRAELERMDWRFRFQQNSLRLVAARDRALAEGIGPSDPRYPSIEDFHRIDWEEENRVHSDILDRYKKTGAERMRRLDEAVREYPQERVDAVTQACVSALKKEKF